MMYAILCYDHESDIAAWTKEEDDAQIAKLIAVQDGWKARGKLGPVGRLMPTNAAKTLRKGASTMVVDGPFAETKEALLGFYVVDCETMEEAVERAKELAAVSVGRGAYEIRPLMLLRA